MKHLCVNIAILLLGFPLLATGQLPPSDSLTVRLEFQSMAPPDSLRVWLIVENRGKTAIRIIRPRQGMLEQESIFGGWELTVTGPRGRVLPRCYGNYPMYPSVSDCIELKTGESFGVQIDVGKWVSNYLSYDKRHIGWGYIPGEYRLQVQYTTPTWPFFLQFTAGVVSQPMAQRDTTVDAIVGLRSAPLTITVPVNSDKQPDTTGLSQTDIQEMERAALGFMTAKTAAALATYACPEITVGINSKEYRKFIRDGFPEAMRINKIPRAITDTMACRYDKKYNGIFFMRSENSWDNDWLSLKKENGKWLVSEILLLSRYAFVFP
jgi:hypothetical protein